MVAKARILTLGGVSVPLEESIAARQSYGPVLVPPVQRTMDGSAYTQQAWSGKMQTALTGEGSAPAALLALVLDAAKVGVPQEMACIQARRVQSSSRSFLLPAGGYRTDSEYAPIGFFLAGNGRDMVRSETTVVAGVATVAAVAGAGTYAVQYWPVLNVVITSFEEDVQLPSGKFGWRLTAQEI